MKRQFNVGELTFSTKLSDRSVDVEVISGLTANAENKHRKDGLIRYKEIVFPEHGL